MYIRRKVFSKVEEQKEFGEVKRINKLKKKNWEINHPMANLPDSGVAELQIKDRRGLSPNASLNPKEIALGKSRYYRAPDSLPSEFHVDPKNINESINTRGSAPRYYKNPKQAVKEYNKKLAKESFYPDPYSYKERLINNTKARADKAASNLNKGIEKVSSTINKESKMVSGTINKEAAKSVKGLSKNKKIALGVGAGLAAGTAGVLAYKHYKNKDKK